MTFRTTALAALAATLAVSLPLAAAADRISDYAPFYYDTDNPGVLTLEGDIDSRTDFRLGRALHRFPDVKTLTLSSQGGTIYDGLSMATTIREYGLKTIIPSGGECYSACAYLFFAGTEREAQGKLGVHQLDGLGGDFTFGQEILSEVFDSLHTYGVPGEVIVKMLRTPPEQMYVYYPDQLSEMGVLGTAGASPTGAAGGQLAGPPNALRASSPGSLLAFLEKHGHSPQLTTDLLGDPMIVFTDQGVENNLLFYDCTNNTNCLSVQFYTSYDQNRVGLDTINAWNSSYGRRFTRAYLDQDRMVTLEMDILTNRDGISEHDFNELLGLWLTRKSDFERSIGL